MTTPAYSRYAAIGLIIDFLTDREQHRIQAAVNKLSQENAASIREQTDGFLFKGVFYTDTSSSAKYLKKHMLSHPFWGEMENLRIDGSRIHSQNQKMSQGLLLLFKACESWQDVRDAIPEFLVPALALNPPLERTRPEGWSAKHSPALKAAYQSIRDELEVRSAARLIY